jgi:alanine racemase
MLTFRSIADITNGKILHFTEDREITHVVFDSRKSLAIRSAVFIAIRGERHDGHRYVVDMLRQGMDQFIVERPLEIRGALQRANVLQVENAIEALQKIAAVHRQSFEIPVIGITGSNGKTIVKEWLAEVLSQQYRIARSPKSYNSQLGVPLSVLQLQKYHNLAIFEAGISRTGEMHRLERVIRPSVGIFTNIGSAHDEGFRSIEEKCREKWQLFKDADCVVYCADHAIVHNTREGNSAAALTWGFSANADIHVVRDTSNAHTLHVRYKAESYTFHLPFSDPASIENLMHCIATALYMEVPYEKLHASVQSLRQVSMRMELKEGINNSRIIDDSYTNDMAGLESALDFLLQQPATRYTAILSDLLQTGIPEQDLYSKIRQIIDGKGIDRLIGVGQAWVHAREMYGVDAEVYPDTEDFLQAFDRKSIEGTAVLVKGARVFAFERIVDALVLKVHGTTLEINLDALSRNLNYFRRQLEPGVQTMVMVKAFAYGSGSYEVANLMQLERVDYLGVAFVDEGIELRKHGISLPIMVMNTTPGSIGKMLEYDLEPEIYSMHLLREVAWYAKSTGRKVGIHIKLDTGMHRLGFGENDLQAIAAMVREADRIVIRSIFSHLAAADEARHDDFTRRQVVDFRKMADALTAQLDHIPLLHILNSAGISRFRAYQFDMVRLGIGLYGYVPDPDVSREIENISTLKTVVSQVRNLQPGDTVGYGRRGVVNRRASIATIAIGYADGYSRAFGNGVGKVLVGGKFAPVIGNICMDMTMIDITGISVQEGDEVIVFGENLRIDELARSINTIPYEILTGVSNRVKRIYYTG